MKVVPGTWLTGAARNSRIQSLLGRGMVSIPQPMHSTSRTVSFFRFSEGFSGISVALLGLSNPIGILFAGLFIGYITVGGNNMQLFDFAPEVIDIIIAAIIYCGALSLLFKNTIYKFQMRKAKKAEKKSGTDRAGKEGQS